MVVCGIKDITEVKQDKNRDIATIKGGNRSFNIQARDVCVL
uniref:Uncharacterized protein n=1 Tax=Anguilla anguilla TaxID=7936 RepID=A0A0E9PSL7_ANGAN